MIIIILILITAHLINIIDHTAHYEAVIPKFTWGKKVLNLNFKKKMS